MIVQCSRTVTAQFFMNDDCTILKYSSCVVSADNEYAVPKGKGCAVLVDSQCAIPSGKPSLLVASATSSEKVFTIVAFAFISVIFTFVAVVFSCFHFNKCHFCVLFSIACVTFTFSSFCKRHFHFFLLLQLLI